jgi:hypothetical protein
MIPSTGRRVKYIKLDPIFYLSEAHPYSSKKIKPPDKVVCTVCSKENPKKPQHCEFCSLWACAECSPKTYPFPIIEDDEQQGIICLICETKLNINAVSVPVKTNHSDNFWHRKLNTNKRIRTDAERVSG